MARPSRCTRWGRPGVVAAPLLLLCQLAALPGGAAAADPLGPGAGPWEVEAPEDHGLRRDRVRAAVAHVFGNSDAAVRHCLVIVKDGALVYEAYTSQEYNNSAHEGNSMTKTLGALVAGWAHSRGLLDIDADITAAYGVPSPRPYPVTARQIMSQALAGLSGPGEAWAYDAGGTMWINTLPQVLRSATGRQPSEIWRTEFAEPLGLGEEFAWPDADVIWGAGSAGTCRDYARLGQLMLNEGDWAGRKEAIVSREYIRQMRTPQTHYPPYSNYSNPCYGLLTWINTNPGSDRGSEEYPGVCEMFPERSWFPKGSSSNVYLAAGVLGQVTMVVPNHNMVLVSMGETSDDYPVERVVYEGVCLMFPEECSFARLRGNLVDRIVSV